MFEKSNENASASIGMLEHHLHDVFSAVRVPGDDFVYAHNIELFNFLEDYCDFENIIDEPTALLLLGEAGGGKSALLSNWLQRRARSLSRARSGENEFVFWHAVGCSRQSLNVYSLMRRLMTDLKTRFDLLREVPQSQDRLSWELPRFLEMASKRGKILIVIDGLHRLIANDEGSEAALNWLPLTFPPNVRVVLSATIPGVEKFIPNVEQSNESSNKRRDSVATNNIIAYDPNDLDDKKPRIIIELERRKWLHLYVKPLENTLCRTVIESYIRKSVQTDASYLTTGSFLTSLVDKSSNKIGDSAGFLLFPIQINSILSHSLGSKPMFLRLILRSLHWGASRGYDIWYLLDTWLEVEGVDALIVSILKTFEKGFLKSRDGSQAALDRCVLAGGLISLKKAYPWHPFFQENSDKDIDHQLTFDFHSFIEKGALASKSNNITSSGINSDVENAQQSSISGGFNGDGDTEKDKSLSNAGQQGSDMSAVVSQSLGDPKWQAASQKAEMILEKARLSSEREVDDILSHAIGAADAKGQSFIDILLDTVSRQDKLEKMAQTGRRARNRSSSIHTELNDTEENGEVYDETRKDSLVLTRGSITTDKSSNLNPKSNKIEPEKDNRRRTAVSNTPFNTNALSSKSPNDASILFTVDETNSDEKKAEVLDPTEGITTLPVYLRGGEDVVGFGVLLGNALSLLLTARHGLKESELWAMLATIQDEARKHGTSSETVDDDARSLIAVCYKYRGSLEDNWRTYDPLQKGVITRKQVLKGMQKENSRFSNEDLSLLLDVTGVVLPGLDDISPHYLEQEEFDSPTKPDQSPGHKKLKSVGNRATQIAYTRLIDAIIKCEKKYRFLENKAKTTSKTYLVDDDMNSGLDFQRQEISNLIFDDDESQPSVASVGSRSLGPVVEESLLSLLCALGVLHSPENQLLVLPSDSESLRKVISKTFIDDDERTTQNKQTESQNDDVLSQSVDTPAVGDRGVGSGKWHGRLITYFQGVSNSLRRCEELPWHLQICRQYTVLRNTIGDLRTFDLMFSGGLRDELLGYWLILNVGPLFISDAAYKVYTTSARANMNESMQLLSDLDTANAIGLTEKEAKKLLMKNQMTPYDIVQEFCISVDQWIATVKPSTSRMLLMMEKIGLFMREFSLLCKLRPSFLRLTLDTKALESNFGIKYEVSIPAETIKKTVEIIPTSSDASGGEAVEQEEGAEPSVDMTFSGLVDDDSLYYYKRWMWIQFPLISLQNINSKISIREEILNGKVSLFSLITSKKAQSSLALRQFETKNDPSKDIYNEEQEFHEIGETPAKDNKLSKSLKDDSFRRNFNVKRVDPFSDPVHKLSFNRLTAKIRSNLTSSKSLEALDNIAKHYTELNSSNSVKRQIEKFTRTLDQEVEELKNIPFSKPSNRSLKSNSRFPSVDAIIKEKADKKDSEVANSYKPPEEVASYMLASVYASVGAEAPIASKITGNGRPGTTVNFSLEESVFDEIRVKIEDTGFEKANQTRGKAIPALNELMLDYENHLERMGRLRTLYDKVSEQFKLKKMHLEDLKLNVEAREKDDEKIVSDLMRGENTMEILEDQLLAVSLSYNEAKILQEQYTKLITFMLSFPPMTEKYIAHLEQELSLSRQQVTDLLKHRQHIYIEAERGDVVLKKNLKGKINYYRSIRKILNIYKTKTKQSHSSSQEFLNHNFMLNSSQHKLDNSLLGKETNKEFDLASKDKNLKDEQDKKSTPTTPSLIRHFPSTPLDATKYAQSQANYESILSRTGSSSTEEFIERYLSGQTLGESLRNHQNLAESRVAHLRMENSDLLGALSEIQYDIGMVSGNNTKSQQSAKDIEKDTRHLEQNLETVQMKMMNQIKRADKAVKVINDVKAGVQHIVENLEANSKLLKNIPSSSLVKIVNDEDISRALAWCEERVIAVNEALVLDASKPAGTDDTKPLPKRQTELARLVKGMISKGDSSHSHSKKQKKEVKKAGAVSHDIVIGETSLMNITPRAVLIPPISEINTIYDREVSDLESRREIREFQMRAKKVAEKNTKDARNSVNQFLQDALSTHDSKDALRKANFLANKKQGRNAGHGFALGDLLRSQGPTLGFIPPSRLTPLVKGAKSPIKEGSSSIPSEESEILSTSLKEESIYSRTDIKAISNKKLSKHNQENNNNDKIQKEDLS